MTPSKPGETSFRSGKSKQSMSKKSVGKSSDTDWIFPLDMKKDDSSFGY